MAFNSGLKSYVVTDIEADGPDPGVNSMLSLASISVDRDGREQDRFVVNFAPLDTACQDAATMEWWKGFPNEYSQATVHPENPAEATRKWSEWVSRQPGVQIFVAHPLSFDGAWADHYTQRFIGKRLFDRPRQAGLFHGAGIDLVSMIMAVTGWSYLDCRRENYPEWWLGEHHHSHDALQDALGYANVLRLLLSGKIGPN